mgnify:CR=1 FL=1
MEKTAMDLVQEAKSVITEVTVSQAKALLSTGSIALDVREVAEYSARHIADAHHIPRGLLEFTIGANPHFQDKSAAIIVYCKTGGRSALATKVLQDLGYNNVTSLQGGFDAWH